MLDKAYAVALTKADLLDDELRQAYQEELDETFGDIPHFMISSVSEYNLTRLKEGLWALLNADEL
jgi:GTP-binding protein